jgi:hypothetical protein
MYTYTYTNIHTQIQVVGAKCVPGPDSDSYYILERRARVYMHTYIHTYIHTQIQVVGAEGVPGPDPDSYYILERRARVCMVSTKMRRFIGGIHTVPLSRRNSDKIEWIFSKKEAINPFTLKAITGMHVCVYVYVFVCMYIYTLRHKYIHT